MPKIMKPPEVASAGFARIGEYVGRIVAFVPVAEEEVNTENGMRTAVRSVSFAWDEKAHEIEDLGTILVFWSRVRAQLVPAIKDGACVIGRITKEGRAYVLVPVDDKTEAAFGAEVDKKVDSF